MKKLIILTIILFTVQFLAPIFAQNEQKPRLVVQTGHTYEAISVAFSPDGKVIASGSKDGTIKLWNAETRHQLKSLAALAGDANNITFSPDGKVIAASYDDKTIKLWNIETGKITKSLEVFDPPEKNLSNTSGYSFDIRSISFSPDGRTLASGSDEYSGRYDRINMWNVETGELVKFLKGDLGVFVLFSPNGESLASGGSDDNTVKLWSVQTWKQITTFRDHTNWVHSLSFSPDGKTLATGCWDKTIKLWNVETGSLIKSLIGVSSSSFVNVIFSQDGRFLFGPGANNVIKIWNVRTGRSIKTLQGVAESVYEISLAPDGNTLAGASADGMIKLWNIRTGKLTGILKGHTSRLYDVSISPNSSILASASNDKRIKLWSLKTGQQLKSITGSNNPDSFGVLFPSSTLFSTDNNILAIDFDEDPIMLWDINKSEVIKTFQGYSPLAFSPNGKMLAGSGGSKIINLWDIETGQLLKQFESHAWSIAFSPDNKTLVSGGQLEDEIIKLWNVENGELIRTFEGHESMVFSVSFSPDGRTLASGSYDKTVRLWDVESGKQIKSFEGHIDRVKSVTFSPDGKIIVSGSKDGTVKLWNIETGKLIKSLESHDEWVNSVKFFPRGIFFASASFDGTVKIWRAIDGELLTTLISLDKDDWIVTTPDGRFDTNKLENPQGLHWIMPDAPFTPLSFEVFMRDYYEPNLLPRLLKCTEEDNCEQEFKPVRNLTELNRTQPQVRIAEIKATASADVVQVTVEVEDAVSEYQRNKQNQPLRSGVFDLRLFRDGQLVGYAPDGEGAVGIDKNGKFTKTFTVRLPKNRDAAEFNFTAYAFNADRVKSETAQKTYVLPKKLPMAKGSAYIVTIGVNANENRDYDLRYAANDARRLQEELAKRLPKEKYERIVQIPLVSDYDSAGKLSENNATKAKIKAVLDRLAGKTVSNDALKNVPNADFLKKVQPEDLVLMAFSGHGYASREGIFYLVPYDIGTNSSGSFEKILQKTISSDELSLWLRDIDAGEMMMIVDACHSAAAVQGKDFKPGPMGSRGLGQLSYDKGMRILTATQADNVALELGKLEHGLLTYSLVKNGLELGLADYQPKDDKLFSNEWLSFTLRDVPALYEKAEKGELKDLFVDGKPKSGVYVVNKQKSNLNLQQPSLFDFSRRDRVYQLY